MITLIWSIILSVVSAMSTPTKEHQGTEICMLDSV